MADVSTLTAICMKLHAIDHPNDDPNAEITLTFSENRAPEPIVRVVGTGAATHLLGPRYAFYWREAQRLAVILDMLEQR